MDSEMVGARDIVWISVPFAAGVGAGAFLCPMLPPPAHYLLADCLLLTITLTTILASHLHFGKHCDRQNRAAGSRRGMFSGIFLLAGIFCTLCHSLSVGIPEYGGGPVASAAAKAVGSLRDTIDAIPYPSATTAPLVKALLTGDRSDLTKEITGIFRDSGASHILALSGLHLGVLYLLLARLTAPLGNSLAARRLRYSLIIASALFYAVMTGGSPSIVRAFLFIAINETARLLGRKRDPVRVLLAALTIQLALRPDVIASVGFQLSYAAMAGIFLLYPTLERIYPASDGGRWSGLNPFRKIWNAAMLSISCQAFTAPIVWHYFRTFPKYFILTNLLALPLTSAVMVLSVTTIALSFLGICPGLLTVLNDHAVQTLVFCLKVISGLDVS